MVFSEVLMVLKAPGFGQSMVYRRGQTPVGILSDGCLRHVFNNMEYLWLHNSMAETMEAVQAEGKETTEPCV
ncbi:hypothetical protein MUK42_27363 [Musa troglodytarum]|uniref:Uncharacterized protein n=1 Tax=Musa troglodytarum TaxID=320322 RepID=A0A9E7F3H2_9LILI|nr:hypothetical protein MUK42_27363 [Musa troglodytarum]URD89157.1 hypothetical protein MUK42_27363 [Musa troglodytarum]URD89161.1 hypothetical protein MUK42_27363 [Musa troglodytarum]